LSAYATKIGRSLDPAKGFERIHAVIAKARALAQRDAERLPEIIAAAKALAAETRIDQMPSASAYRRLADTEFDRQNRGPSCLV
jgi:hypothetical protein